MRTGLEILPHSMLKDALPFIVSGQCVGWIKISHCCYLREWERFFDITSSAVSLAKHLNNFTEISNALKEVVIALQQRNVIPISKNQIYQVHEPIKAIDLFELDFTAVDFFGVSVDFVYLNGYFEQDNQFWKWISFDLHCTATTLATGILLKETPLEENIHIHASQQADILPCCLKKSQFIKNYSSQCDTPFGFSFFTLHIFDVKLKPHILPFSKTGNRSFVAYTFQELSTMIANKHPFDHKTLWVIRDFLYRHGLGW